jgi:mannose-6-phosphate isomerase-like protein (cupin superfamily)
MRHPIIGSVLLGVTLATSVAAQPTSYSSSNARTLVATGALPTVSAMPLYFRIIGATISSGEETGFSAGNGILYQMSGTTEISTAGNIKTIRTGEGIFIPGGNRLTLRALGSEPSTYLHFLLSSASNLDQPDLSPATGKEIYRSTSPIPGLKHGSYLLNLSKVTLPPNAPSDRPHRRSGAALHFVLSGFGAETANGVTVAKGPGSISYEPGALVYQWGNPGNPPLTYLVFNLNPESEDAVVAAASVSD